MGYTIEGTQIPDAENPDTLAEGKVPGEKVPAEHVPTEGPKVGLAGRYPGAREPDEIWPYEGQPVDVASGSKLLATEPPHDEAARDELRRDAVHLMRGSPKMSSSAA